MVVVINDDVFTKKKERDNELYNEYFMDIHEEVLLIVIGELVYPLIN